MEEWRNVGVRDEVMSLAQPQIINQKLRELVFANPDLQFANKTLTSILREESNNEAQVFSPQKTVNGSPTMLRLEGRLQFWAAEHISLFALRPQLYAVISMKYMELRNRILGLSTATVRPVPTGIYRTSSELLELSLRYAQSKDIHVILYLAPIRPIQPNPNLPSDVTRFRKDVPMLCQRYNVTCLDYTDLVPEKLWTNYSDGQVGSGQRDFAHFTGAAHKLLAEQLVIDVGPLFVEWDQ